MQIVILLRYKYNYCTPLLSDKDANSVREKLEKDLHSAQAALQEKQTRKKSKTTRLGSDDSGVDNNQMCPHSTGGSEVR